MGGKSIHERVCTESLNECEGLIKVREGRAKSGLAARGSPTSSFYAGQNSYIMHRFSTQETHVQTIQDAMDVDTCFVLVCRACSDQ